MNQAEKDAFEWDGHWDVIDEGRFSRIFGYAYITENDKSGRESQNALPLIKAYIDRNFKNVPPCRCVPGAIGKKCMNETCSKVNAGQECDEKCNNKGDAVCMNRGLLNRDWKPVKIVSRGGAGFALIACIHIGANELVIEITGLVICDIDNPHKETRRYSIDIVPNCKRSKAVVIESTNMGNLGRYIQHSHRPSCSVRIKRVGDELRLGVYTIKSISPGTELTWDYGKNYRHLEIETCACHDLEVCPDAYARTVENLSIVPIGSRYPAAEPRDLPPFHDTSVLPKHKCPPLPFTEEYRGRYLLQQWRRFCMGPAAALLPEWPEYIPNPNTLAQLEYPLQPRYTIQYSPAQRGPFYPQLEFSPQSPPPPPPPPPVAPCLLRQLDSNPVASSSIRTSPNFLKQDSRPASLCSPTRSPVNSFPSPRRVDRDDFESPCPRPSSPRPITPCSAMSTGSRPATPRPITPCSPMSIESRPATPLSNPRNSPAASRSRPPTPRSATTTTTAAPAALLDCEESSSLLPTSTTTPQSIHIHIDMRPITHTAAAVTATDESAAAYCDPIITGKKRRYGTRHEPMVGSSGSTASTTTTTTAGEAGTGGVANKKSKNPRPPSPDICDMQYEQPGPSSSAAIRPQPRIVRGKVVKTTTTTTATTKAKKQQGQQEEQCQDQGQQQPPPAAPTLRRTTRIIGPARTVRTQTPPPLPPNSPPTRRAPKKLPRKLQSCQREAEAATAAEQPPAIAGPSRATRRQQAPQRPPASAPASVPAPAPAQPSNPDALQAMIEAVVAAARAIAREHHHVVPQFGRHVGRQQNQPWMCGNCPKIFNDIDVFRRHVQSHQGAKLFPCPQPACGRSFNSADNLRAHMKTHQPQRERYGCPGCGKDYGRRADANAHMRKTNCPIQDCIVIPAPSPPPPPAAQQRQERIEEDEQDEELEFGPCGRVQQQQGQSQAGRPLYLPRRIPSAPTAAQRPGRRGKPKVPQLPPAATTTTAAVSPANPEDDEGDENSGESD